MVVQVGAHPTSRSGMRASLPVIVQRKWTATLARVTTIVAVERRAIVRARLARRRTSVSLKTTGIAFASRVLLTLRATVRPAVALL